MATARPRLFLKYVVTSPMVGQKLQTSMSWSPAAATRFWTLVGDRDDSQYPTSQPGADPLCQHKMPEDFAKACGEDADELYDTTDDERWCEQPCVKSSTRERANEEDDPKLNRSNPGDRRLRFPKHCGIIGLECAPGVYESPGPCQLLYNHFSGSQRTRWKSRP